MLLDRAPQLASLADWLAGAGAGRSCIVLVEGEAGCGKTSLVRSGTAGVDSWWGWCDPLSTPRPLGPLLDIAPAAGLTPARDTFVPACDACWATLHGKVTAFTGSRWGDEAGVIGAELVLGTIELVTGDR